MITDVKDKSITITLEANLKNMDYAFNSAGFHLNHVTLNVTCAKTKKNYIVIMNDDYTTLIFEKGGETDETDQTIEVR